MSFPKVGDQSSAYAVTLPIEGINVGFDIILFRVGSYVAAITYADIGSPDVSTVQRFTIEAVHISAKGSESTRSPSRGLPLQGTVILGRLDRLETSTRWSAESTQVSNR
jgi:hypothetical protein